MVPAEVMAGAREVPGGTLPRIDGSFALAQRLFFDRHARRATDPADEDPTR